MARKKAITIVGHSNAEGLASSKSMLTAASWLATVGSPGGPDRTRGIAKYVYKNIKVFTNQIPWGNNGSPPTSPDNTSAFGGVTPTWDKTGSPIFHSPGHIKQGAWLDMTTAVLGSPSGGASMDHPYSPPYQYPNTRSLPAPPSVYNADGGKYSPWGNSYGNAGGGSLVGVELPLCWRMSHHWGETIYLVKLAVPGSFLLREDEGLSTISNQYWWSPLDNFDWHPNTGRLYQSWLDKMTGAASALDSGDSLDLRCIVLWMGDNDANQASPRIDYFEQAYKALIAQMRADIDANDWSAIPAAQIPILMVGIHKSYNSSSDTPNHPARCNAVLKQIAKDDDYAIWVDSDDWELLSTAGVTDPALGPGGHFSHNGYITAADDLYDAFITLQTAALDAMQETGQVNRSEVRSRVLNYYERGQSRTDATSSIVNQHINAALFHILNRVGDNAYWLRRITTLSISGGPTTPVTLPRNVHRVLRVESNNVPDYPLHFVMLGHTDAGRMQILLKERFTGNFNVHYITRPAELTKDSQIVPLPYDLIEWLVVETCRRLARASGNTALQMSFLRESEALQADVMRNIQAVRRAAMDRLYGQRRLVTMRYNRGYRFGYPYF